MPLRGPKFVPRSPSFVECSQLPSLGYQLPSELTPATWSLPPLWGVPSTSGGQPLHGAVVDILGGARVAPLLLISAHSSKFTFNKVNVHILTYIFKPLVAITFRYPSCLTLLHLSLRRPSSLLGIHPYLALPASPKAACHQVPLEGQAQISSLSMNGDEENAVQKLHLIACSLVSHIS